MKPIVLISIGILLCLPLAGQRRTHLQIITVPSEESLSEVLGVLNEGIEFAEVARQFSSHPTADRGGYLGQISVDTLTDEISERIREVKAGEIVHFGDVVRGYTVLKVLKARDARTAYSELALLDGKNAIESGDIKRAVEYFKEAVSNNPGSAEGHYLLGKTYRLLSSYDMIGEAKAEFRQALAIDPALVEARLELAEVYLELARLDEAKSTLSERLGEDAPPVQRALLGEVNRQQGRPMASVLFNREALEQDNTLTVAHFYLAKAYLDLGRVEDAVPELELVTSSDEATGEMFLTAGRVLREEGMLERSIVLLERAVELEPSKPEPHLEKAIAFRQAGELNEAVRQLHASLRKVKESLNSVEIEGDPGYFQNLLSRIHFELGLVYQQKDQFKASEKSYRTVLQLNPDYGPAHHQIAELLFALNRNREAYEHALKAGDLGYPIESELLDKMRNAAGPGIVP